jgi:hypothetical protein
MAANLRTRLEALEARSPVGQSALAIPLLREGMSEGERAECEAAAIRAWETGHGRPFPPDGRVMAIMLCGRKPEGVRHA